MTPALGIVVPCYNEEDVLPETCRRLLALRTRLVEAGKISEASRVCFVDDGSRDRTWELIEGFGRGGLPVLGVKLSRNKGHQAALLAGLREAPGDCLVTIDADLQDDVEAIEKMVDAFSAGNDIVYGVRGDRTSDSLPKRLSAESFYRLLRFLGVETVFNHADYRLMSRRAVTALQGFTEVNLYLRGIVPLLGYRTTTVEYQRSARFAGVSKYPLRKMLVLAIDAVTSFSVMPLRLVSLIALLVFFATLVIGAWIVWVRYTNPAAVPGWASTVLPVFFLGGLQLACLGVLGEYLGKVYAETKRRPLFHVDRLSGDFGPASGREGEELVRPAEGERSP